MKTSKCFSALLFVLICFSCNQDHQKKETTTSKTTDTLQKKTVVKKDANTSKYLYGIDISHYQGDEADYLERKKDSLTFIICKATEGITYTDPDFYTNWKTITEHGFIKGAYHFYITNDDVNAQADNFLKAIATLTNKNLPPVIDFESGGIDTSQSVENIQTSLLNFLNIIETKTKRKPIIYVDKL